MKWTRVGKRDANTDNTETCYQRGNRRISVKNLSAALQAVIDPLDNQLGYMGLARDPPNLIYPLYLSPPSSTLTRLLGIVSCLALRIPQQAPCCICHPWLLPMLPSNSKNTHYTLKICGLCFGTNLLSMYDNGRGKEKRLQLILTTDE